MSGVPASWIPTTRNRAELFARFQQRHACAAGSGTYSAGRLAAYYTAPQVAQWRWPGNTNPSNRVDRSGDHHTREISHVTVPLLVFPLFSFVAAALLAAIPPTT